MKKKLATFGRPASERAKIFPRVDEDGFPYPDSEPLDYLEFFDYIFNISDDGGIDDECFSIGI